MIVAIVQARYSSSRLPGKVLKKILGTPMLVHQVERVQCCKKIDKIVVATSVEPSDDKIESVCKRIGIKCHRGSLDDVLDRFYQTAKKEGADHLVRLTGDCPLIDPEIVDQVVTHYLDSDFDYCSNTLELTFPDGLDVEVLSMSALEKAWKGAKKPSEREHVTPYIYHNETLFTLGSYENKKNLSHLRLTVDEAEDFELVENVYKNLYPENQRFLLDDVLGYLDRVPHLLEINKKFETNEGYKKSMKGDEKRANSPIKRGLELQEKAKRLIPGLSQLLSKRPDLYSYGVWPGYYKSAKGSDIWDLDNNKYLDMSIGGIGANILGYCDPDIDRAVTHAITKGSSSSLLAPEEVQLAETLCEIHPWASKVRFARTGGESMVVAVRIARAYTDRSKIAFCGYHGWHDWYLSANLNESDALGEHLIGGLEPKGVPKELKDTAFPFEYNNIEMLEDIVKEHGKNLGVIVMEPIRDKYPENGFLQKVRKIADEVGAVLIMDEISAGFRMNTGGAHLMLDVVPDIAVFSKALGNGYPIAAIIGKSDVMEASQETFISSTYWTERIGPTAGLAVVRKHKNENVADHLMSVGSQVQEGWRKAAESSGIDIHVGGIPPLSHFSFEGESPLVKKALFVQEILGESILASTSFYPMYSHKESDVSRYIDAVHNAFENIMKWEKSGHLEKNMRGSVSISGFQRLT